VNGNTWHDWPLPRHDRKNPSFSSAGLSFGGDMSKNERPGFAGWGGVIRTA
jgi:hypothetical protein